MNDEHVRWEEMRLQEDRRSRDLDEKPRTQCEVIATTTNPVGFLHRYTRIIETAIVLLPACWYVGATLVCAA